jgi:hypothetical protein
MADVTVSIDWTPMADVVEPRGDMWHKACASRVPMCAELVRGTKTQELASVWRSVRACHRTKSFSPTINRSADKDADGGAPCPFQSLEACVLVFECSSFVGARKHGFRTYHPRMEAHGYSGCRFSTID